MTSSSPAPKASASTPADVLRAIARELRTEAEFAANGSRDFGRGMSWAAVLVESRADDAAAGVWMALK